MIPQTKDNYIGIEIEFVADMTMDAMHELLIAAGLDHCCDIVVDCSVQWDDENDDAVPPSFVDDLYIWDGFELRLLCKESELFKLLPRIRKFFSDSKAKVNKTCGLHVHLDMRNRDLKQSYSKLAGAQGEIAAIIANHRRGSEFCKFVTITNEQYYEFIDDVNSGCGRDSGINIEDRYAVNILAYAKHKTIEIRAHEGTVNTMEIYNWCQYLLTIIGAKKRTAGVKQYVERRISKNRKPV